MKFHLDNNIIEGTPEELVKYQELLEEKEEDLFKSGHMHVEYQEEEEDIKEYTFWYLKGSTFNNHNVIKATLGDYFEDSKGRRYTYQAVHGLIHPITNESVHMHFEGAKHEGRLLKYYPSLDAFTRE